MQVYQSSWVTTWSQPSPSQPLHSKRYMAGLSCIGPSWAGQRGGSDGPMYMRPVTGVLSCMMASSGLSLGAGDPHHGWCHVDDRQVIVPRQREWVDELELERFMPEGVELRVVDEQERLGVRGLHDLADVHPAGWLQQLAYGQLAGRAYHRPLIHQWLPQYAVVAAHVQLSPPWQWWSPRL